jgi:NAD(P)-dependent dehydrogenase (short-subunit alcohol dehydrogenase family)
MDLSKTTIVAGARGLIGSATSGYLKNAGWKVLELDLQLGHDLTDEAFVRKWFSENPAGSLINLFALNDHVDAERKSNHLMDIPLSSFELFLKLNLTTLFSVCREFARSNAGGSIVNFTSTYGLVSPNPNLYDGDQKHIAYGVSKAGVVQLTRHLAAHLAPGFRVNCIAPGGVRHKQSEAFQAKYGALAPLGRMMDVQELVGMIEFLISGKSTYCTGATYAVDGGWTAW